MTPEEHKERHVLLHQHMDELLADFIRHHPDEHLFLVMPIERLMHWSFQQTLDPTTEEDK